MKLRILIALVCLASVRLAFGPAAWAGTVQSAPVELLDTGLITAMKEGSAGQSFADREKALAAVVDQTYDMQVVTQNSVGFLWATLPADQKAKLVELIGQYTATSYASQFKSFGGESFTVSPDQKTLGTGYIVQTKLTPGGGGAPVELDYVVRNGTQGWRITDVLLGGTISQVAVHASDFASLVSSGDASRLITALQNKITALQSSASS